MGNTLSLKLPELFSLTALAATGLLLKHANTQAYLKDWSGTCSMGFRVRASLERQGNRFDDAMEWVPDLE